ncbi:ABC transporter permease, partial [Saccharothrix algeriensis]
GFALLLLFAYAVSWGMAIVGLMVRSPEVFNNASFIVIFPLTFIANTFVQESRLPGVLKVFAEWNPVSAVTQAARQLFGNTNPAFPPPDVWSLRHPVLMTLIWVVVFLAVFVPLATRQYPTGGQPLAGPGPPPRGAPGTAGSPGGGPPRVVHSASVGVGAGSPCATGPFGCSTARDDRGGMGKGAMCCRLEKSAPADREVGPGSAVGRASRGPGGR